MKVHPVLSALLDIAAGLAAIVLVVGGAIAFRPVGDDFRALFALNGVGFFLAGMSRSSPEGRISIGRVVRICAPGFLGVAALIVNNGLHRLSLPAALAAAAVATATMGLYARRKWGENRRSGAAMAGVAIVTIALAALIMAPFLSGMFAFERQTGSQARFNLALDDRTLTSAELRGRVTVLSYWATWCSPCAQELPHIQRVYQSFRNDPRVAFYAVDLDWNGETPQHGHAYLDKRHVTVPMAFDSGQAAAKVLKVYSVPALILIDKKGAVRLAHFGYDGAENLESSLTRHIQNLLAEP